MYVYQLFAIIWYTWYTNKELYRRHVLINLFILLITSGKEVHTQSGRRTTWACLILILRWIISPTTCAKNEQTKRMEGCIIMSYSYIQKKNTCYNLYSLYDDNYFLYSAIQTLIKPTFDINDRNCKVTYIPLSSYNQSHSDTYFFIFTRTWWRKRILPSCLVFVLIHTYFESRM